MITINRDELIEILASCFKKTLNMEMSGFGIPIYLNNDGSVEAGGFLSDNSWQPGAIEIYRVRRWESNEDEQGIIFEIDDMIDNAILEIERDLIDDLSVSIPGSVEVFEIV